jgi:hypothetical protein
MATTTLGTSTCACGGAAPPSGRRTRPRRCGSPSPRSACRSPALAAADLTPTLPADNPLKVTRTWLVDDKKLVLRFELTNTASEPVEIGALGIPLVFNNILSGRSLDEAHARSVFYDPYIGNDAGYVQVVRLSGQGPVLLVVPDGATPFEAWKPILTPPRETQEETPPLFTDPTPRGVTFEGFFDWMVAQPGLRRERVEAGRSRGTRPRRSRSPRRVEDLRRPLHRRRRHPHHRGHARGPRAARRRRAARVHPAAGPRGPAVPRLPEARDVDRRRTGGRPDPDGDAPTRPRAGRHTRCAGTRGAARA